MTVFEENKIPEILDDINVVQDLSIAMDCLQQGFTIARYEFGDSMMPFLQSGQFCKIVPLNETDEIKQGDCVFADVNGTIGTHMVWMIVNKDDKPFYCIATTQGQVIGWTDKIIAKSYAMPYSVRMDELVKTKKYSGRLASTSSSMFGTVGFSSAPVFVSSNYELDELDIVEDRCVDEEEGPF